MYKSKIHRARVTNIDLDYDGSLTIDPDLLEAANILPNEKVQVLNINNGTRAETYIIEGSRGSREICINGALARWAQKDDLVIIIAYAVIDENELKNFKPRVIRVDQNNNII
jgi:aspartate 1-decarboxylase